MQSVLESAKIILVDSSSNPFDIVDHHILLEKLNYMDIRGILL